MLMQAYCFYRRDFLATVGSWAYISASGEEAVKSKSSSESPPWIPDTTKLPYDLKPSMSPV